MIGYFDTSSVVPLVIPEPGSIACQLAWSTCETRISSVLVIAEAHAALALAVRIRRLTSKQHVIAQRRLDERVEGLDLVVANRPIAELAAKMAYDLSLRGYDAMHAASAYTTGISGVVAISGDKALIRAFRQLGMEVIDTGR